MKRIITIFTTLILSSNAFAQAPNKMSYQAVIRNNSNALVTNQTVGMRISILQSSATGTAVYVETQTPTTNINGLASIEIGGGSVVSGTFSTINWANGPFFIKTETDPSGGINYTISGTSQLLSVPYALYAANAGTVTGSGNFTHYIGEQFGGGVIFHLWKDAQGVEHGLIVDKNELSTSQAWSNVTSTLIGPSAQSSWDGLNNSNAIVVQAGHTNSAAALCLNSTNGGQNDWYLPAVDELCLLWQNRFNLNKTLSTISGAVVLPFSTLSQPYNLSYWSSSEENFFGAWVVDFDSGTPRSLASQTSGKGSLCPVRAIRAF